MTDSSKGTHLNLLIETEPLTPAVMATLLATRRQPDLICDRCLDPNEIVVAAMEIATIDENVALCTLALCRSCLSELPRGHLAV